MTRDNGLNRKTNRFTRRLFTEYKHKCSFSGINQRMRGHVWASTWSRHVLPAFVVLKLNPIANMCRWTLQTSMSSQFKSIVFPWPLVTVAVLKGFSGRLHMTAPNAIPSTGKGKIPLLFKEEALRRNTEEAILIPGVVSAMDVQWVPKLNDQLSKLRL